MVYVDLFTAITGNFIAVTPAPIIGSFDKAVVVFGMVIDAA